MMRALSGLNPVWSAKSFLDGVAIYNLPAHRRAALGVVRIPRGDLMFGDRQWPDRAFGGVVDI